MQLLYNAYYKLYGIRRIQQLISPRLFPMTGFFFPRNSTYHFVSHDETVLNPDPSKSYIASNKKRIMMDIVADLTEHKGNARKVSTPINTFIRPFLNKHRQFKYMRAAATLIHDPTTLTIVDYAYLQKLYRYTTTPLLPYYKWFNIEKTLWDNILKLTQESERQNFVLIDLPDVIPSVNSLKMYTERTNNSLLRVFDKPSKHFILEMWRWISEEARETSLFGAFKQENLDKVNLVFTHANKWCVLNMGQFNQWRKPSKDSEVDTAAKATSITYTPMQLQKLLLKFFISIESQTAVPESDLNAKPDVETPDDHQAGVDDSDEHTEIDNNKTPELGNEKPQLDTEPIDLSDKKKEVIPEAIDDLYTGEIDDETFKAIDEDLKALEYIEKKTLMHRGIDLDSTETSLAIKHQATTDITFEANPDEIQNIHDDIYTSHEPEDILKNEIDKHVEYGLMSAADYRTILKQAESFMQKPSPYAKDASIKDYVKISQESLAINPIETQIPDIKTVTDKSMLESSLNVFDSKYIKHVMPKDITAMAVNIQKAGIVIHDYTVEHENSVLGEYEIHSMRIKPIDGVVSTVRFKIPKVDEEGRYLANGNTYRLRKQRGDGNSPLSCI